MKLCENMNKMSEFELMKAFVVAGRVSLFDDFGQAQAAHLSMINEWKIFLLRTWRRQEIVMKI